MQLFDQWAISVVNMRSCDIHLVDDVVTSFLRRVHNNSKLAKDDDDDALPESDAAATTKYLSPAVDSRHLGLANPKDDDDRRC